MKEGLSSFHLASTFGLCTIWSTIESCTRENFDCKSLYSSLEMDKMEGNYKNDLVRRLQ